MRVIDTGAIYRRFFSRREEPAASPKFDAADAAAVAMAIVGSPRIAPEEGVIQCTVEVQNRSKAPLGSTGEFPIHLSAFLVRADQPTPYVGDFPRHPAKLGIPAGKTRSFDLQVALPEDPGRYVLAVTLVQEGVMWFHLCPSGAMASCVIEYAGQPAWWTAPESDDVLYGNIAELNQLRLRTALGCGDRKRPLMLHCETVNICNLQCVICPYKEMTRKKQTMDDGLFRKIVDDYCRMGGGDVVLTPSVGDVFMDKGLVGRIEHLKSRSEIRSVGFVTNTGNAGVLSDRELAYVVNSCKRINISVYGLDEEETAAMTRRIGVYEKILGQIRRVVGANRGGTHIVFAFRLLKPDARQRAVSWMQANFGATFRHEVLTEFGNWGGAVDTNQPLPFAGQWHTDASFENHSVCAYPVMHAKVAVNGDVKFCSCIDYDSNPENILGNVCEGSLVDIYNGPRAKALWRRGLSFCEGCTHAVPIARLVSLYPLLRAPIEYLGV
jgi:MoaA/NifB/PqqE/SkfB family radical SAM enzyme